MRRQLDVKSLGLLRVKLYGLVDVVYSFWPKARKRDFAKPDENSQAVQVPKPVRDNNLRWVPGGGTGWSTPL